MATLNITKITQCIAHIDGLVTAQLHAILNNAHVKALLTLWSELNLMCCSQAPANKSTVVKLLDIKWHEIEKDINTSVELENSVLHDKVCEDQFGMAGGEPFGMILANYQLDLRKINIVSTLNRLSELGAISLAPIFTNLALETFAQSSYATAMNFDKELDITDLTHWQRFRKNPQARFLYVTFPTAELTIPTNTHERLPILSSINLSGAALLTIRTIQSFIETHWFSEILGFFDPTILNEQQLPLRIQREKLDLNCRVFLKNAEELALTNAGFILLMQHKKNDCLFFSTIYSSYIDSNATGLLLEHILAACRFGHMIKIITRQKIGSLTSEHECEQYINRWLNRYTGTFSETSLRVRYPLKKHQIKLYKVPGKVGSYKCQILLEPHMKLENMSTQIMLHSEIYTSAK